jgi:ribosomal protein L11 methyltransferase
VAEGYVEVSFTVSAARLAELTEQLRSVAPGGLTIEEPYLALGPDEGVRLEAWRPTVVRLYLPLDQRLPDRRALLSAALARLSFAPETHERSVRDEDWAENWKQFFPVEHVGRHLVIRPSWREYSRQPQEIVLHLDPGMAFGTGQHPTTRLCLAALEDLLRPGMDVIDLGCGSGILAVAAAKLGALSVLALDIEPVAVDATRTNVARNGAERIVRVIEGSLAGDQADADAAPESADLIVANINAATIAVLAPAIVRTLRDGGVFIGSGIIAERIDEPLLALAAAGLRIERLAADGDWRALIGRRRRGGTP